MTSLKFTIQARQAAICTGMLVLLRCFPVLSASLGPLQQADSLFAIGQYKEAQSLYQAYFQKNKVYNPRLLLKMAFIAERSGSYTRSLYYLSCLAEVRPSVLLYSKMESLANEHGLKGYLFDDISYFILFLKNYGDWLKAFCLLLTGYVLYEIYLKSRRREYIRTRHKVTVIVFLLGLLVVFNIGDIYREGVVASDPAFIREKPSSASMVTGTIAKGNKVVILYTTDQWKLIWWERRFVYVRQHDIMLI